MILIAADRHHRINRVLLENQNRTILEAAKILDKVENQSCNLGFKKGVYSMKKSIFGLIAFLIFSTQVLAAPSIKIYELAATSSKQASIMTAIDKFMKSPKGKSYQGGLHVNTILANGVSPATISFVLLMPSLAAIAEWEKSLVGDPDIAAFWQTLEENATPTTEFMGSLVKSWGNASNSDRIWMVTNLRTTDPMAVVTAQDKLMAATGDKFPGQIGLHGLQIGTRTGANNDYSTHMMAVGYESVAEMEDWMTYMNTQPAWAEFLGSLRGSVVWQGTSLVENTLVYDAALDLETFLND